MLLDELLDAQARHFAAPPPAGGEGDQKQRGVARIRQPVGAAGREQGLEHVARHRALALAHARPRRRAHRKPERGTQRRRFERAQRAFPVMQGRPAGEPPPHRRRRMRPFDPQQIARPQGLRHLGRHAVAWLGLAPRRIPEMMRDEFQRQGLGRRPGQGASGRGQRPGLEIGEIGGERAQAVLAHAFPRQMF